MLTGEIREQVEGICSDGRTSEVFAALHHHRRSRLLETD